MQQANNGVYYVYGYLRCEARRIAPLPSILLVDQQLLYAFTLVREENYFVTQDIDVPLLRYSRR